METPRASDHSREWTRREALAWLASATAGACLHCHLGCAEDRDSKPTSPLRLADLIALRNQAAREFPEQGLILVRTDQGLAAYPNQCTHRNNPLAVDPKTGVIFCPTHGSRFGLDGKPAGGPATRALKGYWTSVDEDGTVRVDRGRHVPVGTWAPLPDWAKKKDLPETKKE